MLVAVFGVIPWAQDKAAKQDLVSVRTAEGVANSKDGGFEDMDGLTGASYLPAGLQTLSVDANDAGTCYLGVSKSKSGKVFYSTDKLNQPREMTPSTASTGDRLPTPCVDGTKVQDLVDDTGGYDEDVHQPVGDGGGTADDPGVAAKLNDGTTESGVAPNPSINTGTVTVVERTATVGFENTSAEPETVRYSGRATC